MPIMKTNVIKVIVTTTKTGKKAIRYAEENVKGRKLDKCAMSFYFPAYSYYAIYWDKANYDKMADAFLSLPNIKIVK